MLRWKDGIRLELTERGSDVVYWVYRAQDAGYFCVLLDIVMKLQVS
jgi:bifunctional DNA-binding transcriptional regulator/antitoxin component of YhaV-PrlF toxin-antitoxin module